MVLDQCSSKFNVYKNYLRVLLQCQFWLDKSDGAVHGISFHCLGCWFSLRCKALESTSPSRSSPNSFMWHLQPCPWLCLQLLFLLPLFPPRTPSLLYMFQIYPSFLGHTANSPIPWSLPINVSLRANISPSTPLHPALAHWSVPS